MPKEEQDFIDKLLRKLKGIFKFKRFEILEGKGIISDEEYKVLKKHFIKTFTK